MHWGDGTDDVLIHAYVDGDLVVMFKYFDVMPEPDDRDKVFVATIAPDEFVATVEAAADFLERDRNGTALVGDSG